MVARNIFLSFGKAIERVIEPFILQQRLGRRTGIQGKAQILAFSEGATDFVAPKTNCRWRKVVESRNLGNWTLKPASNSWKTFLGIAVS